MRLLKFAHNRYRTVNFEMYPYARKTGIGMLGAAALGAGIGASNARLNNIGKDPEDQKNPLKAALIGAGIGAATVGAGALAAGVSRSQQFSNLANRFRKRPRVM